jgi:methylenetetrahydrofolate reductase (NADPH)
MSTRIGVGDSMRFLAKNRRAILRLLRPGRYSPDRLIVAMASLGEGLGLRGTHIFTFNQVAPTMAWHRRSLQRLS